MSLLSIKTPLFSLKYGDTVFNDLTDVVKNIRYKETSEFLQEESEYLLEDGLKITTVLKKYKNFSAHEWVSYFENTSSSDSKIISGLNDCEVSFEFDYDAPPKTQGYSVDINSTKILTVEGSNLSHDEFGTKQHYIRPGNRQKYTCLGGRSSQGLAPFFDINQGEKGVISAIGWTGQWQAVFERTDTQINIKTGIEDVEFKLFPNEKIRTSSILLLEYDNGQNNGHNQFRKLIKDYYSIIGHEGRPQTAPLSAYAWGGISTEKMLHRINGMSEHKLGFEYYWIDAGWYGESAQECPNEFTGDWWGHSGNWVVNKNYHPDELHNVSKLAKDKGMKLLLWFEPERANKAMPLPLKHPEWFFKVDKKEDWLLNLGNKDALNYTIDMVANYIEKLELSCYRQDFNMDPLEFWRANDESDRKGINEIKHIMGMYEFWDALLVRFPHLIIDNCASGGRRIDIETLKRSIPLWRSDYQCVWDCDAETTQVHNTGISWWLPYSGTGVGVLMGDTYRTRSCYSASLVANFWAYGDCEFSEEQPLEWVKKQLEEYKSVREYFSCDYYPLINHCVNDSGWATSPGHNAPIITTGADDTGWTAWQYDRPEQNDGIILAFRRSESPFPIANVNLGGIAVDKTYHFRDADTGEVINILGENLIKNGFNIEIYEKRGSKLYFYSL